ncbi:hypothetical protein diail_5221 [Diaporthe ilicicola]|nr:hypothetical protein diail_5221 [Diaporthe ilicicola]
MAATIASNSQDWIASQLSATAAAARPSRTMWNYVRDRNDMMVIDPVLGFYFNPPPNAKCRWSTANGTRKPQFIRKGLHLPSRTLLLWNDEKLESEAARIREKHWDEMRTLVAPQRFEDLYEYFDSATLWTSGAVNLWNLVNLLANDARHNWHEVEKQVASECNNWVLDWLESFPAAETNRESLIKWDQKNDILTAVTSQFDWDNDLKFLDLVGQNILRECYLFHFERLTGKKPNVARFNTHAATDKPVPANNSVIVPVDTTAKASASHDDAPPPSSPVQALATILEDTAAVKTATKVKDLTIDTIASTQIPHHTVSAPATAVPRIIIEPRPAKEAEDIAETKDVKYTTEDDSLTNQELADRVQSTARQLSLQATPGERSESMLSASTPNVQPRAVSVTETTSTFQTGHQLQQTLPEKAGTIPRNMKGNKQPFRGPPRSPQGYGPNRQQTSANTLTLPGQPPIVQHRAPMGPPHQQHMMQVFGPPHHGMQPPPPGLMPPTSTHGMPAYADSFTPSAQGSQPGVGVEQMSTLPGLEFQNQMSMGLPRMDQLPLGHPQAAPMSMPPQYMGQQNVGTPMYQPNGYIPQSQQQPGFDNGNKKMRRDFRRDSTNSSGSRSKVRDDPIHGPVYTLKPRKHSNTSTGQKSSNLDDCPAIDPKQATSNPNVECKNRRGDRSISCNFEFIECPCWQCARSSRSIYVKHDKLHTEGAEEALMKYFAGWGAEQAVVVQGGVGSLVVFRSDHDSVRAIQEVHARPNQGRDIPGLGQVSKIWYALYSKHYTPPAGNPAGLPRGVLEAQRGRRRSSSNLSRDSNPYRSQQPNNVFFNNPDFANRGPGPQPPHIWHGEAGGPPNFNMVPIYQRTPQRGLWNPDDAGQNRKSSKLESINKDVMHYQPKTYPKRPDGAVASKEDWRSKPPAEEVIEDISSDEAAADISSAGSSQGARSVKVCLPNEAGSSRSRSTSPNAVDRPVNKQARKNSSKSGSRAGEKGAQSGRSSVRQSKTRDVVKDDVPISSVYRKATAELAVPVEEFQPTAAPQTVKSTWKHGKESLSCYSKVTSELTEATEDFDFNTVIRHKSSRSPLPKEWMANSVREPSKLQDRLGALTGALQLEALGQQPDSLVTEGPSVEAPMKVEASTQQSKKNTNKGGNSRRKNKSNSGKNASTSATSSATPTETQSRGPSRASTNRPESANGTASQSSSRPQSATQGHVDPSSVGDRKKPTKKKKNTKSQRQLNKALAEESSAATVGQAKTGGSQDQARAISGQESTTKKPETLESGPAIETRGQSVTEPSKSVDDPQIKTVVGEHGESKESSSQNTADGSELLDSRSPQKSPRKDRPSDDKQSSQDQAPKPLQTVFEPPAHHDRNNGSPEANLFPNQKFTIDKVKKDAAMAPSLMSKESDGRHRQPSTMKLPTHDGRIALPLLPPNAKPFGYATVAARGSRSKSDDPFVSVKGEPRPEDWIKDKAVKSSQKPSSEPASHQTSPTPSPERKSEHRGGSIKLNASAKTFAPSSVPSSPAASVVSALSAKAAPFHTKKPSLPGQKGDVEQRFITPAEQVVDPTTVTQPGPPTKEKKRAGSAPGRGGNVNPKERAKSSDAAAPVTSSIKTAARTASATSAVTQPMNEEEFPTLAAAASVPQKRAASAAVKASVAPAATSLKTHTAAAPKATAAPKPAITSPNNIKLGQRGDTSAPVANKQDVGDTAKAKASENQWTTVVGSSKKAGEKNNGANNNRSTSGRPSSVATGQGGRAGGQGNRGGRPPVGEERKGG